MTAEKWMDGLGVQFVPEPNTGCWIWMGKKTDSRNRYGRKFFMGRTQMVHRVAWQILRGPIPDGLTIDHLCENGFCVNPDHMRLATMRENITRSTRNGGALNARKTHCKRGHEFTPENTRIRPNGRRQCRACDSARARDKYRRSGRSLRPETPPEVKEK